MTRHGEPTLAEMLEDPIVRALMARDGVRHDELMHLMNATRLRLAPRNARRLGGGRAGRKATAVSKAGPAQKKVA